MLPVKLTLFVGRRREIAELVRLVDGERLVSLVGPPGCGKTRLGVEVGAQAASHFADGVRFVDLAPIADPASIANTVGIALGISEEAGRPMDDVLIDGLREADPILLLLDNCEHLVDAVAALAQRLVATCPSVRLLTTSRAALGVPGERVWRVPPLSLAAAVELFADRARSASGGSTVETEDEAAFEGICARLDCLPLAVELTAAWTRVLSPGQILERMSRPLPSFPGWRRGRGARHDTMAAAVEWSRRLLPVESQLLFQQVSLFAGSFDLEAMEAIAGADGSPGDDGLLGAMAELVDNSLVLTERSSGGPMRYRMLEPVRQHAEALLAATGTDDTLRRRHFDHYLGLAERYDPWRQHAGGQSVGRAQMTQEDANLAAAYAWARRQRSDMGLRLAVAWAAYFASAGRVNDGLRWLEEALAEGTQDRHLRAAALREVGYLAWRQGDYDKARAQLDEALSLAGSLEDAFLRAHTLTVLSATEFSVGDCEPAAKHARDALDIYRMFGDELHTARALVALAWTRYADGDAHGGDEDMRAALAANRSFGNPSAAAYANFGLAYGAALAGEATTQRHHLAATLAAINDGGIVDRADWLRMAGVLAAREGRFNSALRLHGGAETFGRNRGGSMTPSQLRAPLVPLFEPVLRAVTPKQADRLVAHGRHMHWDELTAEAFLEPGATKSPLTAREQEISELVAEGLTNVAIAHKLVISARTVESHIDHIRQKLGLSGRSEIIVWVLRDVPRSQARDQHPSS